MEDKFTTEFIECPVCGGTDLYGVDVEVGDSYIHQVVECENCGSSWKEVYRPHYYGDIVVSEVGRKLMEARENEERKQ